MLTTSFENCDDGVSDERIGKNECESFNYQREAMDIGGQKVIAIQRPIK